MKTSPNVSCWGVCRPISLEDTRQAEDTWECHSWRDQAGYFLSLWKESVFMRYGLIMEGSDAEALHGP